MRGWIRQEDLEAYKQLCKNTGSQPSIIEENDGLVHVNMSSQVAQIWMMSGYWIQMG